MTNMIKRSRYQPWVIWGLCAWLVTATGCEPLRKKFVRKKKADQESAEIQPVLDPLDYPAPTVDTAQQYRYRYSLWRAWYKDLLIVLDESDASEKRARHILNQMIIQLDEMEKLLREGAGALLGQYRQDLAKVDQEFSRPDGLRNPFVIKSRMIALDRDFRGHFQLEKIKDQLR